MATQDWQLEAFEWLPKDSWNVDNLMGPQLGNKLYCKICDVYVVMQDCSGHVSKHIKEREKLIRKQKLAAAKIRKENMARAREAKKQKREYDDI